MYIYMYIYIYICIYVWSKVVDALQLHPGRLNYSFALQHHTGQTTLLHILYIRDVREPVPKNIFKVKPVCGVKKVGDPCFK